MEAQFGSLAEFFWMEGHGPYVWAAYGITFLGLAILVVKLRLSRKNFYRIQASIARRNQSPQGE